MLRKSYFHKKPRIESSSSFKKIVKESTIWIFVILLAVISSYFAVRLTFDKTVVSNIAMEPTLKENSVIIINKIAYIFKKPSRNDVIVYKQPNKEHSYFEIRRIIGLPGETIHIKNGLIYIDGKITKDVVKTTTIKKPGLAEDGIKLGFNEYFVLSDNREDGEDSRFTSVGNILSEEIIGQAIAVEKPFKFIDNLNLVEED